MKVLSNTRRVQFELEWPEYSLEELCREVRDTYFPEVSILPRCFYAPIETLAFIRTYREDQERRPEIFLSSLFNHPRTPEIVARFILKHEFLHILIPPRKIGRTMKGHPPEFWEREALISPEKEIVWKWVLYNFEGGVRVRPRLERIDIIPSFYRDLRFDMHRFSFEEVARLEVRVV